MGSGQCGTFKIQFIVDMGKTVYTAKLLHVAAHVLQNFKTANGSAISFGLMAKVDIQCSCWSISKFVALGVCFHADEPSNLL